MSDARGVPPPLPFCRSQSHISVFPGDAALTLNPPRALYTLPSGDARRTYPPRRGHGAAPPQPAPPRLSPPDALIAAATRRSPSQPGPALPPLPGNEPRKVGVELHRLQFPGKTAAAATISVREVRSSRLLNLPPFPSHPDPESALAGDPRPPSRGILPSLPRAQSSTCDRCRCCCSTASLERPSSAEFRS